MFPLYPSLALFLSLLPSYLQEFGFTIPDRPIMVDDIRVRGSGKSGIKSVTNTKMGSGILKATTVKRLVF